VQPPHICLMRLFNIMNTILIEHLKRWEGCKLTAYQDQGGVWTVGVGCTGPDIKKGVKWTQEKADSELNRRAAEALADAVRLSPILETANESRQAAVASFIFNVGLGNQKRIGYIYSTFRKKIDAGDWIGAAEQIKKWNRVSSVVNNGLINRRRIEAQLLLKKV